LKGANERKVLQVLNRLLGVFQYSLASYLRYAHPWTHAGNARLFEAVRQIGAAHQAYVRRIGELILKRRGNVEAGGFPTRFAAYNYLALDYLAERLVDQAQELIQEIAWCVAGLGDDSEARLMAEDILASERQHHRRLTELVPFASPRTESRSVARLAA
jgi:hypothetical protein